MKLLSLLVTAGLSGCITMGQAPTVTLGMAFDSEEAARLIAPGANTIKGNGFMRQRGGAVISCAGSTVTLVPATGYAYARFQALYDSVDQGVTRKSVNFEPDLRTYRQLTRTTRCDSQGNFTFEQVADGEFFVMTSVSWTVGYSEEGGYLMRRVAAKGGRITNVILAP